MRSLRVTCLLGRWSSSTEDTKNTELPVFSVDEIKINFGFTRPLICLCAMLDYAVHS
jgi:hypothetical protein